MSTGSLQLISQTAGGQAGALDSETPRISADGSRVVFASAAAGLVADDADAHIDVFLWESGMGLRRITVAGGAEAQAQSMRPMISADGSTVMFDSYSANLVAGDTNDAMDVFSYDVPSGALEVVSLTSAGLPAGASQSDSDSGWVSVSADGNFVAFAAYGELIGADTNGLKDVHVLDRSTGVVRRVSVHDDATERGTWCAYPQLSPDGRFVAFVCDNGAAPLDVVFVELDWAVWVTPLTTL